MPSPAHEVPLALLRERPEFLATLLHDLLGVDVPEGATATVLETDFTQVAPAEYDSDLVIALRGERDSLGVVIEVQRAIDPRKQYTWPLYTYSLCARLEIPVVLLVFCTDRVIARWAGEQTGRVVGQRFVPLVLGPDQIPRITTVEQAAAAAELSLLSVLAHHQEPNGDEVIRATLGALATLDEPRRGQYSDWLMAASEATRRLLEELMNTGKYAYPMSDFARTHYGRGLADGKAEGETEGEARGKAEAILTVLAARNLAVHDLVRARILACTDPEQLQRWLTRAVHCAGVDELLS